MFIKLTEALDNTPMIVNVDDIKHIRTYTNVCKDTGSMLQKNTNSVITFNTYAENTSLEVEQLPCVETVNEIFGQIDSLDWD